MDTKSEHDITTELYGTVTQNVQVSRANLAILCGMPYSGKSTVAKQLSQNGFVHIWLTTIKKQYDLDDTQALRVAGELTEKLLVSNYRVVVDFLNHTEPLRSMFRDIAVRLDVPYIIIYVNTPIKTIYERKERSDKGVATAGRSIISTDVIQKISSEMTTPDPKETITIGPDDSVQLQEYLLKI